MADSPSDSVASLGDALWEPGARSRADQVLRSILLSTGLLEDVETATGTLESGMTTTLRGMRQTGPLGGMREEAQTALLGGVLYEYSDGASATRAAEARRLAVAGPPPASRGPASSSPRPSDDSLARLRRGLERVLLESSMGSLDGSRGGSPATSWAHTAAGLDSSLHSAASSRLPGLSRDERDFFRLMRRGSHADSSLADSLGQEEEEASESSPGSSPNGSRASPAMDQDPIGEAVNSSLVDSELLVGLGMTGDTSASSQVDTVDESITGFLRRLAAEDESLVRSWLAADEDGLLQSSRRVLQMGAALAGTRLSEAEICSLPRVCFNQAEEQQCSICLEAFRSGEFITELPCRHFFHVPCVARWFRSSAQCPLCRSPCRLEDTL